MKHRSTPPLHWLKAFEVAANALSFTKAAAELSITQSAVSKQIKNLEHYLGQDLFVRKGGGLTLTEAGMNYLPSIARGFSALEQGTRNFLNSSEQVELKIKANYAFATLWLCRNIKEFLDTNPGVRCTISPALWAQDFSVGDADLEIHCSRAELLPEPSLQLAQEKLVPVCAPNIYARIRHVEDFQRECILDITGIGDTWDYWLSQQGGPALNLPNRHYSGTFVFSVNMALEGLGIALAHGSLIGRYVEKGLLIPFWDLAVPSRDSYFCVLKNPRTKEAALMSQWLLSKFSSPD